MQRNNQMIAAFLLAVLFFMSVFSAGCAAGGPAVPEATPEATVEPTPTSEPTPTPTPSPVPTPALSLDQKKMMVWKGEDYSGYAPASIILFYSEINGEGRLIWAVKEQNAVLGVYDFYEAFNHQLLFQVTVPMDDQLKANPNTYTKYISQVGESFSQYTFLSSGKLLEIDDFFCQKQTERRRYRRPLLGDPFVY